MTTPTFEDTMQVTGRHADGKLLAGRIGPIGVVLFNQPEKRNALSLEMWEGIRQALDEFAANDGVRVVVYAGAGGKAFTAGADISQFKSLRGSAEANDEYMRISEVGRESLRTFPKPGIACIQGFCLGGGLNMALHADIRVAARDAVFGIPAARMGIVYGLEQMERLVSAVGPARARLMLYTARRFSAQEAFDLGLVQILASQDVVRETLDLAAEVAENAPLTIAAARFAIEQLSHPPAIRDHASMAELARRCMDSDDFKEGRTAFTEKRKPRFTGR